MTLWLWIAATVLCIVFWLSIWVAMDSPRAQVIQIAIGSFLIRIWQSITRRTE